MDYIQIVLLLYIIDKIAIHRPRYKLAIDTCGQRKWYWSLWWYRKDEKDGQYYRTAGRRIVWFTYFVIPHKA